MEKGDYVVAVVGEKEKPTLLRLRKIKNGRITGVVPNDLADTPEEDCHTFEADAIRAYLGENPPPGSVYGVRVEPLRRIDTVKHWGQIKVYIDVDKADLEPFYSRLSKCAKLLSKSGHIYPHYETELRPKRGKWAGMYCPNNRSEVDRVIFHTDDYKQGLALAYHELGHGVWFRLLSDAERVKWIKVYQENVEIQKTATDKVERILKDLRKFSGGGIYDFCADMEESETVVVDAVLDHISSVHHLKQKHVNALLLNGDSIAAYMPKAHEVEVGEPKPPITEYAGTSPEELWAETFMFYKLGNKLPKKFEKMMRRSLLSVTGGEE